MEKYLFLSDVDGTLLRGDSGIGGNVRQAAGRFMDKGGLLSLCTGRSQFSAAWVAEELGIRIPCVLYNGGAIYDFSQNKFILSFSLKNDILEPVQRVYELFPDVSLQVYTKDRIYLIRKNEFLETYGIKEEMADHLSAVSEVEGEILKITMAADDRQLLKRCGEEVFNTGHLQFAFSSTHFAEVFAEEAGKEIGLRLMAERYGIKIRNVFAAGDGITDLPMLQAAGYSFAPVNAAKAVLEACDMKIPPCEKDGMEKAFNTAIERMA